MQLSVRAAALRAALERAVQTTATVAETNRGWIITAEVAETATIAEFRQALRAVQAGDGWGSAVTPGVVTIWTEIRGAQ